jgi:hypothetical protein
MISARFSAQPMYFLSVALSNALISIYVYTYCQAVFHPQKRRIRYHAYLLVQVTFQRLATSTKRS